MKAIPGDGTDVEQQEYECLKTELRRIYEERADGAILRSKMRWIEHGEKPTKYFINMERRNYNKKTITELESHLVKTVFLVEFYQFFFELLGQKFLDNINASYDENELSICQRRGVITLIPKEDANLKDLSNWRPITSRFLMLITKSHPKSLLLE